MNNRIGGGQLWDWFCPHSVLTLPTKLAVDKEILFSLTIDYYTSSQYLKILNPYFSQSLNFIKWCQILCSFSHCSHVRRLLIRLRGFLLLSWLFMHCFIISFLGSLDVLHDDAWTLKSLSYFELSSLSSCILLLYNQIALLSILRNIHHIYDCIRYMWFIVVLMLLYRCILILMILYGSPKIIEHS